MQRTRWQTLIIVAVTTTALGWLVLRLLDRTAVQPPPVPWLVCVVMLVIAGSAFSAMAELTGARGALHGRRTGQLEVQPFDYLDASHFFAQLSATDRVRAYACFGGIAAYLRYWEPDWTLPEALQHTSLNPGHFLNREGEELLRTEFHQEALYASILRAIAHG